MRRIGVLLAALLLALLSAPPAVAIEPPTIDPAPCRLTRPAPTSPPNSVGSARRRPRFPNANFADKPWANDYLRLSDAQKFATGEGVTVAVIDTGVNGSPRVPAEPGGDFVDKAGNGMSDCDSHGTLTASIIGGRPAPTDGFIGVAPDARILSLRQTSDTFQPVGARSDPNDPNTTQTAGSLRSLARAIVHAANLGAQVINISEAACYKITRPINESSLGAAIDYAVNVKGAVIIVAAGNTGQDCSQNPPPDPRSRPTRAAGSRCRRSSPPRGTRRWCSRSAASARTGSRAISRCPARGSARPHPPRTSSRSVTTATR